jgi:hypothetical protein
MNPRNVYVVDFPQVSEIFVESASGAFDFDRRYQGPAAASQALQRVRELVAEAPESVELYFSDDRPEAYLYEQPGLAIAGVRVSRHAAPGAPPPSVDVLAFLKRYPSLALALAQGDYGEAGKALDRSNKLNKYQALVSWLVGKAGFLVFALYWMQEFDSRKEDILEKLLSKGKAPESGDRYARVFDLLSDRIEADSLRSFRKECASKLRELLVDQHQPLVVSVVGSQFRSTLAELSGYIQEAQEESRRRALVEGLAGGPERIKVYLEALPLLVAPEPFNPADRNALAILLRDESGSCKKLGYVKREVAEALRPLVDEGRRLEARLARLGENSMDIVLRVAS